MSMPLERLANLSLRDVSVKSDEGFTCVGMNPGKQVERQGKAFPDQEANILCWTITQHNNQA